jgi:hypothetical protein
MQIFIAWNGTLVGDRIIKRVAKNFEKFFEEGNVGRRKLFVGVGQN